MKTDTFQQEILLVTTTTISNKQLCDKNASNRSLRSLSDIKQMEQACWNGLLYELFPEIMLKSILGRRLYIWQIYQGAFSLQIHLSELPLFIEKQFSIDPNIFLWNVWYN